MIQHEIDHLDGVLIIDRTSREQRREAMRVLRGAGRRPPAAPPCAPSTWARSTFAATVLQLLAAARPPPAARRDPPRPPARTGRKLSPPPVADAARELGIDARHSRGRQGDEAAPEIAAAAPERVRLSRSAR